MDDNIGRLKISLKDIDNFKEGFNLANYELKKSDKMVINRFRDSEDYNNLEYSFEFITKENCNDLIEAVELYYQNKDSYSSTEDFIAYEKDNLTEKVVEQLSKVNDLDIDNVGFYEYLYLTLKVNDLLITDYEMQEFTY